MPHSKLKIQRVADTLIAASKELSPVEYRRAAAYALNETAAEDIVAITQCLPPELRELMPKKHLN
jgi:hypothetical protein